MMVENIYMNSAFSSLYLRLSIILNFSFRSSNERKDLSARAVSRRRTLSYFYWFARWGVVKGRQPPVLPPLPVAVSAPLPPLYAKEVKRERWRERKRKTLLIPASPSFPFGFPTATRSGLSTLGFFRRMLLKKSTHEKERSVSPLLRVTLQPFIQRTSEFAKISRSAETAWANSTRKVKSFLSSLLRQIAAARAREREDGRPPSMGERGGVKRGKSFSRDFICDGGAICPCW